MAHPIRVKVRGLLFLLRSGELSKRGFVEGLKDILRVHGCSGYMLQAVGLTLWAQARDDYEREELFRLVDEADPRVRIKKDSWLRLMS